MYGRIGRFAFIYPDDRDDLDLAVPQDLVQAHMWVNLAASRATGSLLRQVGEDGRNEIADRMTPDQITEAQRLATAWDAAHPRDPKAPHCTPCPPAIGSGVHPVTLRSAA